MAHTCTAIASTESERIVVNSLREWDLNPRPPDYEPGEHNLAALPRYVYYTRSSTACTQVIREDC